MEPAKRPDEEPQSIAQPAVIAERRARRAEAAEAELRQRLADADLRVAELELTADKSARVLAQLDARTARDLRIASVLGEAADAVRAAREAVDHEIRAREAAEAAYRAERIAREAAEQSVVAERAARDAATAAIVSARVRATDGAAAAPPPDLPASEMPPTDELLKGLSAAAERLKQQAPAPGEPATVAKPGSPPPAGGGLVGRTARALRKLRSERP
ncbi:MAG: hypothetical protein F2813_03475 [Actinobacteria bacterium]|uniref:Unannotated protein n=1 Tax=freshwater metagenome TaxID=449393 RepID=A0A6J5ZLW7_9ZZZZ|nr:hypothetical protein [Actinomycetota bacterium]